MDLTCKLEIYFQSSRNTESPGTIRILWVISRVEGTRERAAGVEQVTTTANPYKQNGSSLARRRWVHLGN